MCAAILAASVGLIALGDGHATLLARITGMSILRWLLFESLRGRR